MLERADVAAREAALSPMGDTNPWRKATSRHVGTIAATPLGTSWRFKSSHPHFLAMKLRPKADFITLADGKREVPPVPSGSLLLVTIASNTRDLLVSG